MWWRRSKTPQPEPQDASPRPLRDALRQARLEAAERTGVVVDLRDAEAARLELLNDALDPLFADIPAEIEMFDRALSRGDPPRLWIDPVAHIHMGRDKRAYRFVQDSRYGRKVLAESLEVTEIVAAVTRYVARRILEREHALVSEDPRRAAADLPVERRRRGRSLRAFLLGVVIGIAAVFAAAWLWVHQAY